MKFYYVSDIHLEHIPDFYLYQVLKSFDDISVNDSLILVGDICNPYRQLNILINYLKNKVKYIIYISGNHEYYGSSINYTDSFISSLEKTYDNFYYLNNKKIVVNDIEILGGTGWSNVLNNRVSNLNDFKVINGMTPEKMTLLYESFYMFLKENINNDKNQIIISHFLPCKKLISKKFKDDPLNFYFCNGVYDTLYDCSPKYWLYGHDHNKYTRKKINNTIFLTNQGDYGNLKFNLRYFEM